MAERPAARVTAFSPGASPPPVESAIRMARPTQPVPQPFRQNTCGTWTCHQPPPPLLRGWRYLERLARSRRRGGPRGRPLSIHAAPAFPPDLFRGFGGQVNKPAKALAAAGTRATTRVAPTIDRCALNVFPAGTRFNMTGACF